MPANGFNGKSERAWVQLRSSEGEAELHLEGAKWSVWVRTDVNADLALAATGSLDGVSGSLGGTVPFEATPKVLRAEGILLDPRTRAVTVNGTLLEPMPAKEYALLAVLMHDPKRVFTKQELLRDVWGYDGINTRTLDSHASRLRRRLSENGRFVVNCWGVGYKLVEGSVPA